MKAIKVMIMFIVSVSISYNSAAQENENAENDSPVQHRLPAPVTARSTRTPSHNGASVRSEFGASLPRTLVLMSVRPVVENLS